MPNANARMIAPTASSTVAPNRVKNTSRTSVPGETPVDWPKSPVRIRPRYLKYCTMTGWSRPSTDSSSARFSGVARSPSSAVTGPPGRLRSQRNSSSDSTNSTSTSCSSRRTVYLSIGTSGANASRHFSAVDHDALPAISGVSPACRGQNVMINSRSGRSAGLVDRAEALVGQRAGHQPLHVPGDHDRRRRGRDRHPRQVLAHQILVDLDVSGVALGGIGNGVGRLQVRRQLRTPRLGLRVEPVVGAGEERADEVVRGVVVTGPAQQV